MQITPEAIEVTKKDDGSISTTGRHAPSIKSETLPSSDITLPQGQSGVNTQDMQNAEIATPQKGGAVAAETDLGQKNTAETAEGARLKMSMADFTDVESPAWNNVEYDDVETRADLQGRAHQEMVNAGLKQKMNELKSALHGFLGQLKGGSYEFEVNGNILEARLYDTGIKEVMEKVTQDKVSMLYHSEELFQNARYLYSTPDYEGNPNIYRRARFIIGA